MTTRPVGPILAKRLRREKRAAGSWRELQASKYPIVPAGTLCRIERTNGDYLPRRLDYREALGIPAAPCPTCHRRITVPRRVRRWMHLIDLDPAEIAWLLENREVVA